MLRHIAAGDISGGVTLVARKGRIAHFEAHGQMDLDAKKAMQKDALFRIASMSKPITGVAIMMLVEEGKVRLTDPVSKFIPEFKNLNVAVAKQAGAAGRGAAPPQFYTVPAEREITVRDLLTHTSGLVSGPISTAEAAKLGRKPTDTLADYIPRLGSIPLEFQPGSRWSYSPGAGFDTLGRIVEIASGQTFDVFLKQHILDPLGMKDTFFTVPPGRQADVAVPYNKSADGLTRPQPQAARSEASGQYFSGAGGLTGSTADYLTFSQMLLNGGQLNGVRLLGRKTIELMTSDATGPLDLRNYAGDQVLKGYGFGLGVRVRRSTGDNGWMGSLGDYGWAGALGTYFWIDPKEQLIGIVMIQTRNTRLRMEYPNLVYQAVVD